MTGSVLDSTPGGKRLRKVVTGKTKQEVQDKLKVLHDKLTQPVQSSRTVALKAAVDDWLADGLNGRSAETIAKYRSVLEPVLAEVGGKTLANLTAADGRELPRLLLELVRGYLECFIDLARGIAAHACVEPYSANVGCGDRLSCRRTMAERPSIRANSSSTCWRA